jgi:hypothetical protein
MKIRKGEIGPGNQPEASCQEVAESLCLKTCPNQECALYEVEVNLSCEGTCTQKIQIPFSSILEIL